MGKPTGFIEFDRMDEDRRDPTARIGDWNEFLVQIDEKDLQTQGARCMDCVANASCMSRVKQSFSAVRSANTPISWPGS